MRLTAINCIFLACAAVALASETRPKRHLHQIKEMIANKLFGNSASNPSQSEASEPDVKFFKIPGFDSVVIKAVPKGSEIEPPPIIEKIPPNSQIGIIGSYLGTNNLNETYNALIGVKNLLKSGILDAKHAALLQPTKGQYIVSKPLKPCAKAEFISAPALEPIRGFVKPPKVPELVPTQYSYKQVNQDGSLTTYTSSLDLNNGVKVTEEGKTLPFFIDRIQKIPVQLPVPVLPEVSKIIISNPFDVGFGPLPMEVVHPGSSYSYKQMHHDGKLTTYSGLPSFNSNYNGAVIVTESGKKIPPPPLFLMDRIEKVAATASFPKVPFIDFIQTRPMAIDVPAGHVMYSAPVFESPVAMPVPGDYAYTQIHSNGGKTTTHLASGFVNNPAVLVTEHKFASPPFNPFSTSDMNTPKSLAPSSFSYNQVHSSGKVTKYTGADVKEYGVNLGVSRPVLLGAQPVSGFQGMPPASNSFSYKQVGNGKVTTYTGTGISHESQGVSPAVISQSGRYPVPPPHLTERIEKIAAGAKFNRPPIFSTPLVNPFAFPDPASFVRVPSVQPSVPQRPVKTPSASGMSPFVYKHVHSDGSVTSFGGDGLINSGGQALVPIPPSYQRVFESPIYTGPFPVNVNANAVKPSTPVSGSYSYKLVNNGQIKSEDNAHIDRHQMNVPSIITASNEPFPVPPVSPIVPTPVQGCVDPEVINPNVRPSTVIFDEPVPLSYTYKQISHSQPDPFLVVNVEDPVMGTKKANVEHSQNNQGHLRNGFPVGDKDHSPNGYMFMPPSIDNTPIPQAPQVQPATTPQSSFSYKQVTNEGLYEYSDEFNSGVKTNQDFIMSKPQDQPSEGEKTPLSSPKPALSNRNSLSNNPIVVPEQASFSFKQSNSDGSTITTVMDNGQNSLSVKVEEPLKPESAQPQDAPRVNSGFEQVTQSPSVVSRQTNEAPSTESARPKKKLRRRVVKRVKNRGDIPDTE